MPVVGALRCCNAVVRQPGIRAEGAVHVPWSHGFELCVIVDGRARCSSRAALSTFLWAFTRLRVHLELMDVACTDDRGGECRVHASPLAWTVYFCALSLHAPMYLHPMALRLAARFYRGGDLEKYLILKTVLAWRGCPPPPSPETPGFEPVRLLPRVLTALDWRPTLADVLGLLCGIAFCEPLLAVDTPWSARNVLARALRPETLAVARPPKRHSDVHQRFSRCSPAVDNVQAVYLAAAFSLMEGTDEPVFDFDVTAQRFILVDASSDVWFVVT